MKKQKATADEKWDRRFLDLAKVVGGWSKDPSTKVGAVLVRPDRTVASLGYNGFPRGVLDHETRYANRDTKYEMVVHAEINALLNSREDLEGYTLYVTPLPPCAQCAATIIQRGIGRIVIEQKADLPEIWKTKFQVSQTMFNEAGVAICIMPEDKPAKANDNDSVVPLDVKKA